MPLTPCHAAAAGPIRRLVPGLPLVPLVLGTMAPDFEYILRLRPAGEFGHTGAGLFLVCVPAGMAAWGAFEILVRPGLGRLLPAGIERAVERRAGGGAAAVAVLFGAASHLAWDSFTHPHGWVVERWTVLGSEAAFGIPWCKVLQHGSTVVGGVLVGLWMRTRVRGLGPLEWPEGAVRRWSFVFAASSAGALLNAMSAPASSMAPMLGYAALGAMAAFAVSLVLAAGVARSAPSTA